MAKETIAATRLYSASEAAALIGVDNSRVRQILKAGQLKAQKVGADGRWLIAGAAILAYIAKPRHRSGKTLKQLRARRRAS